ncbi:MAG: hypothetical protein HQL12_02990 [Candidatus Omnitrophica bacterium]|nr:hypothetical protein [Candidatus Omnitrophota bacterium]
MDKKEYRKFGGRVGNLTSYTSFWLADDHMLVCEDSGFLEKYKRFYFKDIQAVVVKKTNNGIITTLVVFVLAMICLWFLGHATKGWNIFWDILTGFLFLILVINIFKGQTCNTYIQTAVQKDKLNGLNRVKKFDSFLSILKPLIQSFQGEMDTLILQTQYEEALGKMAVTQRDQSQQIEQESLLHTVLFLLFIIWSFLVGMGYRLNNEPFYYLILFIYLALAIGNIMAVVKQLKINLKPAIKNWAWVSLVFMGLLLLMGYVSVIALSIGMAKAHPHAKDFSSMNFLTAIPGNHFMKGIFLFAIFVSFLIGSVGLILSAKPRSEESKP